MKKMINIVPVFPVFVPFSGSGRVMFFDDF